MKRKIITDISYIKQKSEPIDTITAQSIITYLEDSIKDQRGIWLTAIQIGITKKVAIIRIPNKEPINLINSKIIEKEEPIKFKELCLSIPGLTILTKRYNSIIWENGDGQRYSADGIEAIVVQHEIDHMDGKTILDRKWRKRRWKFSKSKKTQMEV